MQNIIYDNIYFKVNEEDFKENLINKNSENVKKMLEQIKKYIEKFCFDNNINFNRQGYVFSGFINNLDVEQNTYATSSIKCFNFFGKYYFENHYDAIEIFDNGKNNEEYSVKHNDIIICFEKFTNKTISKNNTKYLEFYVAPKSLVSLFEPGTWVEL